jgi:hypothetical protein
MNALLAKIGFPQAVGLYVDGTSAHAVGLVSTPFGQLPTGRFSEPLDPQRPHEAIERLLARLPKRRFGRMPVAVGVPIEQTYFTTRPINVGSSEASPRVLLREALRSSNIHVDEMAVDVVKSQPDHRHVVGIVACRQDFIRPLIEAVGGKELRFVRAEPAPCALLRRAVRLNSTARRAKVAVRLFLSEGHALAVFAASRQPLMWRRVVLPKGDEASAIVTVIRSLTAAREHCGINSEPSIIVIHGRADLKPLLDTQWIGEQVQLKLEWTEGPAFLAAEVTHGLAAGCFRDDATAFDLARQSKPPARISDLIPWPEVAVQAALVVLLALFLFHQLNSTRTAQTILSRQMAQHPVGSLPLADLQRERTQLQQQVAAVQKFLDTRILWSEYHREISESLPDSVFLTAFHGVGELATAGRKGKRAGPKKTLVLKGAVFLPENGAIPYEVDRLLSVLRNHPTLSEDFKVVELAELKQIDQPNDNRQLATFTIVCLPDKNKPRA